MSSLSPEQQVGVRFLKDRKRAYLADCPGFGKTRTALAAAKGRTLVVCPAAIRDAGVWEGEAEKVGFDGLAAVVSYHSLMRGVPEGEFDTVIFDEAHHLKERKVSWRNAAKALSKRCERVFLLSGTPAPNKATELWSQLDLVRQDMPAYWTWVNKWFCVVQTQHTDYEITGELLDCVQSCSENQDCEHWENFRDEEMRPWVLGRGEELLDLPESSGADSPLWTPMTAKQGKAYREMKKKLLAELDDGITLEALTSTSRYVQLRQISAALGAVLEEADPTGRESGKIRLIEEMMDVKQHPSLMLCYFRGTSRVLRASLERLGKSYLTFSASDSPKARREAVSAFQSGSVDVLLGSIEVIKEGITLTAADEVFLAERSWRADANHQAIRRVVRRGQDKHVVVRQLVTPKSADSLQWDGLQDKIALTAKVDPSRMI